MNKEGVQININWNKDLWVKIFELPMRAMANYDSYHTEDRYPTLLSFLRMLWLILSPRKILNHRKVGPWFARMICHCHRHSEWYHMTMPFHAASMHGLTCPCSLHAGIFMPIETHNDCLWVVKFTMNNAWPCPIMNLLALIRHSQLESCFSHPDLRCSDREIQHPACTLHDHICQCNVQNCIIYFHKDIP